MGGRTFARFAQLPLVQCPPARGAAVTLSAALCLTSRGRFVPAAPCPYCLHLFRPPPPDRPLPSALCTCESAAVSPAGLPCTGPSSQTHPLAPSPGGPWAHRGRLREAGGGLGEGLGAQRGEVTTLTGRVWVTSAESAGPLPGVHGHPVGCGPDESAEAKRAGASRASSPDPNGASAVLGASVPAAPQGSAHQLARHAD